MQVSQKVTVKVIVHDLMIEMSPNGVGKRNLRQTLWVRSLEICLQSNINEPNVGGMVGFEL